MSPFFSIIIPVYNVEAYLCECLDSVLAQTFTDWEAICVDDGSTDGSGTILDEYAAKDNRFIVVHQENAGTHETRITALEMVRGDWVTFLDADDYVVADRYATMLAAANDCDLVWGDVVEERDGKFYYHPFSRAMKRLIPMEGSEILLSMLDSAGYEYEWHVLCSRIYRNDLVRKVLPFLKERHGKFVMCEDVGWSIAFAGSAKKMLFVHGAPYIYRRTQRSSTFSLGCSREKYERTATDFRESYSFAHEMLSKFSHDSLLHERVDIWFAKYVRGWYEKCPTEFVEARSIFKKLTRAGRDFNEPSWGMLSQQVSDGDFSNLSKLDLIDMSGIPKGIRLLMRFYHGFRHPFVALRAICGKYKK